MEGEGKYVVRGVSYVHVWGVAKGMERETQPCPCGTTKATIADSTHHLLSRALSLSVSFSFFPSLPPPSTA